MKLLHTIHDIGLKISAIDEFLSEKIKQDIDYLDTVRRYISPDEIEHREDKIRNARILLSLIRHSLE